MPRSALGEIARIRFVKVAEFQRRGVVHFHVLIRADGPDGVDTSPPEDVTTTLLELVVRQAARAVKIVRPGGETSPEVRWGRQLDVVAIDSQTAPRAAGYVAKYATKATEKVAGGVLIPRVRSLEDAEALDISRHAKRLVKTAWQSGHATGCTGARRWAHQFGFGGHTLTKSREFSVTFGALRAARCAWRAAERPDDPVAVGRLAFAGRGYSPAAETLLAVVDVRPRGDP